MLCKSAVRVRQVKSTVSEFIQGEVRQAPFLSNHQKPRSGDIEKHWTLNLAYSPVRQTRLQTSAGCQAAYRRFRKSFFQSTCSFGRMGKKKTLSEHLTKWKLLAKGHISGKEWPQLIPALLQTLFFPFNLSLHLLDFNGCLPIADVSGGGGGTDFMF